MTNLKKVLALSLAATSVLGTVASATFTDANTIESAEAVNSLVALGIIKGFEDGSFRPTEGVTRAEMAKMLYTIRNKGNDDASNFVSMSSNLTDISGHWAEGYVKYCENQGIIAGYGDNKFLPDANVTGIEAFKMALVTLGYDPTIAELVGTSWDANTLALAIRADLTTDYNTGFASVAQRQSAAQVLYNTLNAEVVSYSENNYAYFETGVTVGEKYLNLVTVDGIVYESKAAADEYSTGTLELVDGTVFATNVDYTEFLNQEVRVLYKDGTDKVPYGMTALSSTRVIKAFQSELSITDNKVTFDGVTIEVTDADAIEAADSNSTVYIVKNAGDDAIVEITEADVRTVTYVNSEKIDVALLSSNSASGSLTFEDNTIDEDVAEDDYILVTENKYTDSYTVEVLATQNGTVTSSANDEKFYIGGTWYTLDDSAEATTLDVGTEYDFIAVGSVIYSFEAVSEISTDYVIATATMTETDSWTGEETVSVKVTDVTGTETILTGVITEGISTSAVYTVSGSEGEWELTAVSDSKAFASSASYNADNGTLGGVYLDDEAVVFVTDVDGNLEVLKGSDVAAWSKDVNIAGTYATYETSSNFTLINVANITLDSAMPGAAADLAGYITSAVYLSTDSEGETVYTTTLFNGSETLDVKIKKANYNAISSGDFVTYSVDADGYYTVEVIGAEFASIFAINPAGTALTLGNESAAWDANYTITDDTQIIYIDHSNTAGYVSGSIRLSGNYDEKAIYNNNVAFKANADSEIEVLYVDVTNQIN